MKYILLFLLMAVPVVGVVELRPDFCINNEDCTLNTLTVGNLTVWDSYLNVSVVDYNVSGDMNITGNLYINGQDVDDMFVNISGDTMTGNLNMGSNIISNVMSVTLDDVNNGEFGVDAWGYSYFKNDYTDVNHGVSGDARLYLNYYAGNGVVFGTVTSLQDIEMNVNELEIRTHGNYWMRIAPPEQPNPDYVNLTFSSGARGIRLKRDLLIRQSNNTDGYLLFDGFDGYFGKIRKAVNRPFLFENTDIDPHDGGFFFSANNKNPSLMLRNLNGSFIYHTNESINLTFSPDGGFTYFNNTNITSINVINATSINISEDSQIANFTFRENSTDIILNSNGDKSLCFTTIGHC